MKFAKHIASAAQNQSYLSEGAYVDFKRLKKVLHEGSGEDFTKALGDEIQMVRKELVHQISSKRYCVADIGPLVVQCSGAPRMSAPHLDTLFECIELNREACRKIAKKFEKKYPDMTMQQQEKLMMHDAVMKDIIEEVEAFADKAQPTPMLSRRMKTAMSGSTAMTIAVSVLLVVLVQPPALQVAFAIGLVFSFLTAWGNAANDICNCVGTAVGCKALTLAQAVFLGVLFEIVGCVTIGPFVAKSITKGMIETGPFEETPELFAFCMCSVMVGTAVSTLLATAYGFPISATHSMIGGLVAVGLASKGPSSVGWGKLGMVAISWVVAPLAGALIALGLYLVIQLTVFKSSNPAWRARVLQPVFLWVCIAVNVLMFLVKGPKFMRVKPMGMALLVATAFGAGVVAVTFPILVMRRRRQKPSEALPSADAAVVGKQADEERSPENSSDDEAQKSKEPASSSMPSKEPASSSKAAAAASKVISRTVNALKLNDEAEEDSKMKKKLFSFRGGGEEQAEEPKAEAKAGVEEGESYFVLLVCVAAFAVCIAHGGNDVGNATGPLSAMLAVYNSGVVEKTPEIPLWATFYGCLGFAVGIITMGRFTIRTVGTKITVLSPSKAFATQIGGAMAVLWSSYFGMPVSTSHCLVGAVVGIGVAQKITNTGTVNAKVLIKIFIAWIVTIPVSMAMALIVFVPFKGFFV